MSSIVLSGLLVYLHESLTDGLRDVSVCRFVEVHLDGIRHLAGPCLPSLLSDLPGGRLQASSLSRLVRLTVKHPIQHRR